MNSESKLLLGLGIGVALGAAIGYIMGTDRREEWLEQANEFADKVKSHEIGCIKSEVQDLKRISTTLRILRKRTCQTITKSINLTD